MLITIKNDKILIVVQFRVLREKMWWESRRTLKENVVVFSNQQAI